MTEQTETLVRFTELKAAADSIPAKTETTVGAIPPQIEQLRHRLVSGEFRDPIEMQTAIVGELVYLTYKDLITRKRFL
jgi:hypothetical protein